MNHQVISYLNRFSALQSNETLNQPEISDHDEVGHYLFLDYSNDIHVMRVKWHYRKRTGMEHHPVTRVDDDTLTSTSELYIAPKLIETLTKTNENKAYRPYYRQLSNKIEILDKIYRYNR